MKVSPKTVHERTVKYTAKELLDNLTVDEACEYLDKNCTDEERELIVSAIWAEYHARNSKR